MKLSLHKKFALTILLSFSIAILIMLVLITWSFDRDFKAHIESEIDRIDEHLINILVNQYKNTGDWSFIKNDPSYWHELTSGIFMRGPPPPHELENVPDRNRVFDNPPPPPPHERTGGRDESLHPPQAAAQNPERLLLDKNKQPIVNSSLDTNNLILKGIVIENETVGYIARKPLDKIYNPGQRRFLQQLEQTFYLIAIISVLVVLLISWFLTRSLIKPILRIKEGTTALTAGNFDTKIDVVSSDELGELSQDFNLLANTLKTNEQSRKQWITDISHELRTPLSILQGEIEAVIDGVREINNERIDSLHKQVLNLNQLVNDLHELSLSDLGALNYEMQSNDLIKILQAALSALALPAEEKSITIDSTGIYQKPAFVLSDKQRIRQLFTNLIMNSLDYTDAPGTLTVSTEIDKKFITIHFMDTAPGISEQELPRLFERLYRGDSSRNRKTGGTGLGLSICTSIVEAHGGSITAKASPLGGLWISVTFSLVIS